MTLELKLELNESQAEFLNHYQDYGFESQESMIQSALEKLKEELEEEALKESSQLDSLEDKELKGLHDEFSWLVADLGVKTPLTRSQSYDR